MRSLRRHLFAGVLLAASWTRAPAIGPAPQAGAEESASQHNTLGIKLANAGQLQAALAEFRVAAGLLPGNAGVEYNLAVTYQKLGETAEALNVFASAVRANPANPPLHLGLGITLLQADRIKEAIPELRRALTLDPRSADAAIALADALARDGDLPVRSLSTAKRLRYVPTPR